MKIYHICPHIMIINFLVRSLVQHKHGFLFIFIKNKIPGSNNFWDVGDLQQKKFFIFITPSLKNKLLGLIFLWTIFS